MQVVHVRSWRDFLDQTDRLEGWAFRGERFSRWPLLSSLSRRLLNYCPDARLWPLREARAIRVFRRKAHVHLEHPEALQDAMRCLAMMQHHGAATRLLDFTKSPFVAAFFGLESAIEDAAVYALNTPALWRATPDFDPRLNRDAIDPRLPGHFERYFLPNRLPVVWFGEPSEMDQRLVAQSGLFVVPGQLDAPLNTLLGAYSMDDAPLLIQLVLPLEVRDEALRALYRMNLTHATLMPDLDGLARSMNQELEIVWDRLIDEFLEGGDDPMSTVQI